MALLGELQRVFENTYDRSAGVELEACVVGPRRCAELVARCGREGRSDELSEWARFFYYVEGADLRLALFYADEMIETLETLDPRRAISESNLLPFLVFAEEASHALHTTFAFDEGGTGRVSGGAFLAELELMARIDAYLLLRHFVQAHADRFTKDDRAWVRHQAIVRWDVPYDDPRLSARYRGAARKAALFVDHLDRLEPGERIAELRRFQRLSVRAKRCRLDRLSEDRAAGLPSGVG